MLTFLVIVIAVTFVAGAGWFLNGGDGTSKPFHIMGWSALAMVLVIIFGSIQYMP